MRLVAFTSRGIFMRRRGLRRELNADGFESARNQIATERVGIRRSGWHRRAAFSLQRFPVYESPNVFVKAAELFLNSEKSLGILNCRGNLQAVANDSFVIQKPRNFS